MFASAPKPRNNLNPGGDVPASAAPVQPPGGVDQIGSNPWAGIFGLGGVTRAMGNQGNMLGPSMASTPKAKLGKSDIGKSTSEVPDPKAPDPMQWLHDFFDELNAPLDMNDPEVQGILKQMRADTLQSAGNAGIFGPYSQNMAEQSVARSALGLGMQKKGMALNAAGILSGRQQFEENLGYEKNKDAYQSSVDQWKYNQENSPGAWIGGGIGAIGGGIAGIFGGDVAGGAKAGFDIGRGIGGGIGGSPPPSFNPNGNVRW